MKPTHLPLVNSVSAPTLHPDGSAAVVAVSHPDFDADGYVGQLWRVPVDGSAAPRRISRGFRDSAPRYSPDGKVLAFIRSAPGKAGQIHIVDAAGGEPQPITDRKLGIESFDWSPSGEQIVFASAEPEPGRYGTVEGVGPNAEDPRLITSFKYRMNGDGFILDKPVQVFIVDVPAVDAEPLVEPQGRAKQLAADSGTAAPFSAVPQPRALTSGPLLHSAPRFSADGHRVYFTADDPARSDLCTELYVMPAEGGAATQLSNQPFSGLSVYRAQESADGVWLFALAEDLGARGMDFVGSQVGVYAAPSDGSAPWRRLTDQNQQDFGESPDLVRIGADAVLALERHRGAQRVWKISAAGSELLFDADLVVTAAAAAAGTVVLSYTGPDSFGDLGVLADAGTLDGGTADGGLRRLSDFSAAWRAEARTVPAVEHTFTGSDGYPVHGWVLLPEGPGPHPVLLNIHGGPFSQYGWGVFDEAQVYAGAGYAVVMCNPRGSGSYGRDHGRAIKEAFGTLDLADVLSFLDGALAQYPQLDAQSLGVMGGSYGGYLTAWTISQDHRFRAAIVERGFLDPVSFVGSSDIGWLFPDEYNGTDPERIAAQSPMAQIGQVRTPTLVIHSEEDWRCPIEQGQRYFVELKRRGVETELLVFPGESHELSRSGLPRHRKQRFEHILRWWAKHLPTAANPAVSEES